MKEGINFKDIILRDDANELERSLKPQENTAIKIDDTPILIFAAENKKTSCVLMLLQSHFSIADYNEKDQNIFHICSKDNNSRLLSTLFTRHQHDPLFYTTLNNQDENLKTPLSTAISCGSTSVAWKLLELGKDQININERDNDGNTALHLAAINNDIHMIRKLISHGADLNLTNFKNQTIEDIAEGSFKKEVQDLLLEKKYPLHHAAKNGDLAKVRKAFEDKEKLDGSDNNGDTILHYAARHGHLHIVTFLIETAQVAFDVKNNSSNTPMDDAQNNEHEEIASYLGNTYLCDFLSEGAKKLEKVALHPVAQTIGRGVLIGAGSYALTKMREKNPKIIAPPSNHLENGTGLTTDISAQVGSELAEFAMSQGTCICM